MPDGVRRLGAGARVLGGGHDEGGDAVAAHDGVAHGEARRPDRSAGLELGHDQPAAGNDALSEALVSSRVGALQAGAHNRHSAPASIKCGGMGCGVDADRQARDDGQALVDKCRGDVGGNTEGVGGGGTRANHAHALIDRVQSSLIVDEGGGLADVTQAHGVLVGQHGDDAHTPGDPVVDVLACLDQERVVKQGRAGQAGQDLIGVAAVQQSLNTLSLGQTALLDSGDREDLGEGLDGLHEVHGRTKNPRTNADIPACS